MQVANRHRAPATADEIWLLEHPPVFTLGLAAKPEHVLAPGDIPVVKIDRGGQVTYHGPGQAVVYLMLDVRKLGYGVKELVRRIEEAVIRVLAGYGIDGFRRPGMPGVYVESPSLNKSGSAEAREARSSLPPRGGGNEGEGDARHRAHAKIAAIGLRVANHATYHGVALNVDMDLEPFARINPCGYEGLAVTQLKDCGVGDNCEQAGEKLVAAMIETIYGSGEHG
ncbi:MAG: lipoyl(octanoyl) transferase LipB [Betaproteobacteria bacterium]|nr:lipoyl(octanoyl) transferase LipB [Betaproteobacteria bacterium]